MFAHLVDHFFLSNRRLAENTKWVVFGIIAVAIIGNFWWFKGLAFGVEGPIKDHTGLLWRKVSDYYRHITDNIFTVSPRLGTYTTMCTSNSSVFCLRYFALPRASSINKITYTYSRGLYLYIRLTFTISDINQYDYE